jgi:sugar phosphate isomerase/epimerase
VNVMQIFGPAVPREIAAEAFAGVCDRARERGLLVHLEALPWTGIPDVAAAWEIVRLAGRANGGLMLDTWHHLRSKCPNAVFDAIPCDRIVAIQLADAPEEASEDILDETLHHRLLPGTGDGALTDLLQILDARGCRAPIGVEVFSDALRALPPNEAARRAGDAARAVLANARPASAYAKRVSAAASAP